MLGQAAQGRRCARHGKFVAFESDHTTCGDDGTRRDHAASRSRTASSPRAPNRCDCRACRTIRASSIPPARSNSTCRRTCSWSAAASSASRWRRCMPRSASRSAIVELTEGLMPGCDRDLVRPLEKRIAARYERILLRTKVTRIEAAAGRATRDVRRRQGARAAGVRQRARRGGSHARTASGSRAKRPA